MRIAYITQSYPPMVSGASLVAKSLAEHMAQRGHKVLVIAASERGESYRSINGNLTVLRLLSYHNPFRIGQRFMLFPQRTFMNALGDFRPDVIHSHDALLLGILSLAYRHKQNIPAVLTTHALPNFAAKYLPAVLSRYQPLLETSLWVYAWWILRQYDAVTSPTPTTSNMIFGMTKVHTLSISNGVDLDSFAPSQLTPDCKIALCHKLGIPGNVPVILHVGRLDIDKRADLVIKAAAYAMHNAEAHLLIVGDGRQKPTLLQMCRSLGIEKQCHFTGYISMETGLPEIYRLADLFVTASEIETQGIVLLEAAASGLPIVSVRATCIPEVVQDGVNGFLTEPADDIALGKAITTLLRDPVKAKKMGSAGRRLVMEHDSRTTFDKYEHLYADLIRDKSLQTTSGTVTTGHKWGERAKALFSRPILGR